MKDNKLIEVQKGNVLYKKGKGFLRALKDIDVVIYEDEVLGLVGESGCGKSTLGRVLTQLQPLSSGELIFQGKNITKSSSKERRENKKFLQYIFQNAKASLNARKKVGWLLEEPLRIHTKLSEAKRKEKVIEMLEMVNMPISYLDYYPSALSGGQAQRIAILCSLMNDPKFLVADEIVSALDVSIQAEVINFVLDLQDRYKMSIVFITHDIRVCYLMADRIAVMLDGRILEEGDAEVIYNDPKHPYTMELFEAVFSTYDAPLVDEFFDRDTDDMNGCPFYDRCRYAVDFCKTEVPEFYETEDRKIRCYMYSEEHKDKFKGKDYLEIETTGADING